MFSLARNALQKEFSHLDRLSGSAKELLVSNIFYNLGIPVVATFTNAFILKATHDFNAVALFMLGSYITLVLGFYLNGWLLRFFSIRKIFTAGLFLNGIFTLPIFFVQTITLPFVFGIGLLLGFPIAFYWANRNFISLAATSDANRNYYSATESLINTIIGVIAPPLIGMIIVASYSSFFLSTVETYRVLTLVATIVMTIGGLVLRNRRIANPIIKKHFIEKISPSWKSIRSIQIIRGFQDGVSLFLPSMLIIFLVGNEATLGTLQSFTAVVTALIVYYLGKRTLPKDRLPQITGGILFTVLVATIFSVFYNQWSVVLYVLGLSIGGSFTFNALNPAILKVLDDQENGDSTNNYAYVVDEELFLNIGRTLGILLFSFTIISFSQEISLRVTPILIGIAQLAIVFFVKKMGALQPTPSLSKTR